MIKDDKGLTPVVGFALILMLLAAMYMYYQIYAIPQICSGYEVRHFAETVREIVALSGEVQKVILEGSSGALSLKLGGSYPEIPFFSTPKGFSGMIATYPAEVKIDNAIAVNPELRDVWDGSEMIWYGSNLVYIPSTVYYSPGRVVWEYGVVAIGKTAYSYIGGTKIINGRTIFIPLLRGNLSYSGTQYDLTLFPYSGGGEGIEITDNGSPITISFKTDLPLSFWKQYFDSLNSSYISSITKSGDYVVITLMQGVDYKLIAGVASFEEGRASQHYLYRISPKAVTVPATLEVQVRDSFNNPVPGVPVTFTSLGSATTLTDGVNTGTSITVKSNDFGIAAVVATSTSGTDVVSASITRPDGSTYEIAFVVTG